MKKVLVCGVGASGAEVVHHLVNQGLFDHISIADLRLNRCIDLKNLYPKLIHVIGDEHSSAVSPLEVITKRLEDYDVVVITGNSHHVEIARSAISCGTDIVSMSDDPAVVVNLLSLKQLAKNNGVTVVIGSAFAPGISCLLAKHCSKQFESVKSISVSSFGTGGPACAVSHHKSLRSDALVIKNGLKVSRVAGTGRELVWFPDPIGGHDCYLSSSPIVQLLSEEFANTSSISSRTAATRRDQLTKWLPMLRKPHPQGLAGAIHVEVRGISKDGSGALILGCNERPAKASGAMAAVTASRLVRFDFNPGVSGIASVVEKTEEWMNDLSQLGVRFWIFEGS